jgi:N-acyl-D-amino-acid deacylase
MTAEYPAAPDSAAEFDLVIAGGTIVDGTGRPRFRGDLGVRGGRIAAIASDDGVPPAGRQTLDATGKIVAPGFIDINSHTDWVLPRDDQAAVLAPLLLQGITTIIGGGCGYSAAPVLPGQEAALDNSAGPLLDGPTTYRWHSFAEFLDHLEVQGLLLNAGFLVGQNTLRSQVLGEREDAPTAAEQELLEGLARQALRDGAFGLSGNLGFPPGMFATNDEILALVRVVADEGGLFTVHARAYTRVSDAYQPRLFGPPHSLRSVREMIDLARQTGVRLQYSHLMFAGRRSWGSHRAVLEAFDRACAEGVDLSFDAFPYPLANSPIQALFPAWFLHDFRRNLASPAAIKRLERGTLLTRVLLGMHPRDIRLMAVRDPALRELEGLDFATIGRRLGRSAVEAEVHVARRSAGAALVLLGAASGDADHDDALRAVLSHPHCVINTTAIPLGPEHRCHNPAVFGTFPRVLGHYSRDGGLFSLEDAVRRMTSYPAERVGLRETGRIAEGCWADLVVFDPQTISDNGWPERSDLSPSGIDTVLVSGEVAAHKGEMLPGSCQGRVLRRQW